MPKKQSGQSLASITKPFSSQRMFDRARGALEAALEAEPDAYRRIKFLRRFHRLAPETIGSETAEGARAVLRELERALRAERARAGHWSYDLNRHIGLLSAYRAEKARAKRIAKAGPALHPINGGVAP